MEYALTVSGLTKTYQDFTLDHVSFSVPSGSIVGLVGEHHRQCSLRADPERSGPCLGTRKRRTGQSDQRTNRRRL